MTLVVVNLSNCSDTVVKPVTIHVLPVADFNADTACEGNTTSFTDLSLPNATNIISYAWDFGDGTAPSILSNPTHTYANPGTYTVSVTIVNSNGCEGDTSKQVIVNPKPLPAFTFGTPDCAGAAVHFMNQSTIPVGFLSYITEWVWDFGDGTSPVTIFYRALPISGMSSQGLPCLIPCD